MATWLQRQKRRSMRPLATGDDAGHDNGLALAAQLLQPFVAHPAGVGETYGQHLRFAASFGGSMIGGGLACLVHAFLPFLFQTTGSRTVRRLHQRLEGCRPLTLIAPPDAGAAAPPKRGSTPLPC